jgi:hypothetical protein
MIRRESFFERMIIFEKKNIMIMDRIDSNSNYYGIQQRKILENKKFSKFELTGITYIYTNICYFICRSI